MLNKKFMLSLAIAMATISTGTMAAPVSGDVSLGLVGKGAETGYSLAASADVYQGFGVDVSLTKVDDLSDYQALEYGFTYTQAFQGAELIAGIHMLDAEVGAFEDDAIVASLAVQAEVVKGLSLTVGAERLDWDTSPTQTSHFVGAELTLTQDVTLTLAHRDALAETSVSVSWNF